MNRLVTAAIPAILLFTQATFAAPIRPASLVDSVGVERRDGKRFALHRVDQGQTLYAVARRYNSTVDAIKSANPDLVDNTLRYDQLLRVPLSAPVADASPSRREQREAEKALKKEEKEKQKAAKAADEAADKVTAKPEPKASAKPEKPADKPARPATAISNGTHVVESGQTLYSLAVRYNVTMADLRRWNDLGADGIQVGQTLFVSEKAYEAKRTTDGATPHTTAAAKPKPKATEPEPVKLEAKPIITPEPVPTPGTKPKPKSADPKPSESTAAANDPMPTTTKGNVKSEIGFAELINGNEASTKYLALHRSAPVGTLVQVRNDITNQSLYVKVIGKLPDTGINNQVLIRLSGRAFEKLSPNGQRFRAEVSYSN